MIIITAYSVCFGNNKLFKPLGGEKVEYTDMLTVSWFADSIITGVNIKKWDSYSKQWEYIAQNTDAHPVTPYTWEIPDSLDGSQCLIKLEFLKNGVVYSGDISSAYFRIIEPAEIPIKSIVANEEHADGILLYPNPIHNLLNIKGIGGDATKILLKDLTGRELKSVATSGQAELSINISDLVPGYYFVIIERVGKINYTYKIIKN